MGPKSLAAVKLFVRAATPEGLPREQLLNNLRFGSFFDYQDISQGNDGNWYAWYTIDLDVAQQKGAIDLDVKKETFDSKVKQV